jgi:ribosomal protein S12 methylthiotransferase
MSVTRRFHVVTLGCARNEVDSDELAGRLTADGWAFSERAAEADVVLVNTCGFIEAAKSESISTILDLSDDATVVATGCLAERYGSELAAELPEAAAVLGFDAYPGIATRLESLLAGEPVPSHRPRDRRTMLPVTPVRRRAAAGHVPGHDAAAMLGGASQRIMRHRLTTGPVAPLKIASGCDRRCAFCAIPSFRGAFVSRPVADIVAEAASLVAQGVAEVVLVSENSTAYGKDVPGGHGLDGLLRDLSQVPGLQRIRVSYLQPAEVRPAVLDAMAELDRVAASFDVSFQHASGPLLRRMRRFGDAESFLALIDEIRSRDPRAGIRSNVIVGFPGETEADLAVLQDFLAEARLDAVGVFGYSDEDGTEAAGLPGKVDADEIAARAAAVQELVDVVSADRAAARVGDTATVLTERAGADGIVGRAEFQGPEDGGCRWLSGESGASPGEFVAMSIVASDGADLVIAREE